MLEYNPDGSLKLTSGQMGQQELEKQSIVITREQLSEKPAKAQIRISFPEDVKNPQGIIDFYNKIDCSQFREVSHEIYKLSDRTFVVKVDKGSMMMYTLLNFMMMCFKTKFEQESMYKQKVILKGKWANFG